MNKKMFIICVVFALIISCKNSSSLSEQGGLSENEKVSNNTIEFSEFTVKIKNKKDNGDNWTELGTLVVRRERDGIETGLNAGVGHSAGFFDVKESEVNNFAKAMTEGGSFKASLYYGYKDEQSSASGIQNKEIKTEIENIGGSEYITFLGDKIKDSGDKVAKYAILLEELKKNLNYKKQD
ncbi:Erp family outer-surface lipoprotein [Borreliella americana]|uniref:Erp family outer-surface lipoprotein n=1 Tax=Borreliella americana TaxID=478807 RepID=UPI001E58B12A|nr:Erp family outer-surface lipoprotein [Borreliella americana]MCD2349566.1 Erp family outer-surface lipoprotein [Borreliella americana]